MREKSLIAYDRNTKKVVAVGKEAEGKDKCIPNVECISPFHLGRVIRKPALVVCLLEPLEEVPMKAYEDLFLCAGAREVRFFIGSIQEFLSGATEKEQKHYKGIVEITKENKAEYAKELLEETYIRMQKWGITKEVMQEMLKEL